jgi:heme/copper-type cytochrome/quinol oxidase subunit 2
MVDPMTTAIALQRPMRRSRPPVVGLGGAVMRKCYAGELNSDRVATQLADIIFYVIATAILVSQAFILRSTHRGMRFAQKVEGGKQKVDKPVLEWAYAIVPALAVVALLLFSWRAMHPETIQVQGVVPGVRQS